MVRGKTTNGLMRHLRDKHGIAIHGSKNKRDLLNIGYYHGYKGYRFIGSSHNEIPFTNFDEVVDVYELLKQFYIHVSCSLRQQLKTIHSIP